MKPEQLKSRVLIVDDEEYIVRSFAKQFKDEFDVVPVTAPQKVMDWVDDSIAVAIVDQWMPGIPGIDILCQLRATRPHIVRLLLTGETDNDILANILVTAINKAAISYYVSKPWDEEEVGQLLRSAVKMHQSAVASTTPPTYTDTSGFGALIGASEKLKAVIEWARRVAQTDFDVLLRGESGTGKDLLAEAIHKSSRRADAPFVALNCAALPANLIESELFGHEKGAYTDAKERKEGHFMRANGGTLFLDEIGELELGLQAKLLRALEKKKITRVGGSEELLVDVRIIAATNRNLEEMIQTGAFHTALYYRISAIQIELPPLRERLEDLPALVQYHLSKISGEAHKNPPVTSIADEALHALSRYDFPGNVRELLNELKQAVTRADGSQIEARQLSHKILSANRTPPKSSKAGSSLKESTDEHRQAHVQEVWERTDGDPEQAAKELGISVRRLRDLLRDFGLRRGRRKGRRKRD